MAIAEEYLYKFKGDNSQLKQKLTDSGKSVDGLRSKIGGVGKAFGGLAVALSVGAIVAKFKSVANEMDNISKSARKLGVATEQLSALKHAADLSGVSFGQLETSIKRMQMSIVQAGDGVKTYTDSFKRAGIAAKDLQGLNTEEQFIKVATAVAAIEDPARRTATAMEIFGRAGSGVLIMAEKGAAGLKEMTDEARKLGIAFDAKAGAAAEKLNDDLTRLGKKIDAVFMQMAQQGAFDVMIAGIGALGDVILTVTGLYGDMLRAFGVNLNTNDMFENLIKEQEKLISNFESKRSGMAKAALEGGLGSDAMQEYLKVGAKIDQLKSGLEGLNKQQQEFLNPTAVISTDSENKNKGGIVSAIGKDKFAPVLDGLQKEIDLTTLSIQLYGQKAAVQDRAKRVIEIENKLKTEGIKLSQKEKDALNEKLDALAMQEEAYHRLEETTKELQDAEDKRQRNLEHLANTFESAFEDAILSGKNLGDVFKSLAQDIARMALRQTLINPMIEGIGGAISSSGLGKSLGGLLSFDGGGYTGSGARSGGMDGKGGMLAMVHPNETVLDHTKGQGVASGGVSVVQYNSNQFTSDTDIDRRIKAHQPIQIEITKRAVLEALQSGGEFSKVNGNRL